MGDHDEVEAPKDADYLYASRDFLFKILDTEVKELQEWKRKPQSYCRDIVGEFAEYDLTNDNLMSLSYGVNVKKVLTDALSLSRDQCAEDKPKINKLNKMYKNATDHYLEMILEKAPKEDHKRKFNKEDDKLAAAEAAAEKETADKNSQQQNQLNEENTVDSDDFEALVDRDKTDENNKVHDMSETKSPSSGKSNTRKLHSETYKWNQEFRHDADVKLYGNTHHPDKDDLGRNRVENKKKGNHAHNTNTIKLGPKSLWNKLSGNIDADVMHGTTVEKILAHHMKLAALKKEISFTTKQNTINNNTTRRTFSIHNSNGDADKKNTDGELDQYFTAGPDLSIMFKPPFWKQFDLSTQGQMKMDQLRKEALRQRHNSTAVVSNIIPTTPEADNAIASTQSLGTSNTSTSVGTSTSIPGDDDNTSIAVSSITASIAAAAGGDGENVSDAYVNKDLIQTSGSFTPPAGDVSGVTTPQVTPSVAGIDREQSPHNHGTGPTQYDTIVFSDLIKSIEVFFHLTDDEISKLENKCRLDQFADSELILQEGDLAGTAYIIATGFVQVQKENGFTAGVQDVMNSLNRGDTFGDVSPSADLSNRKSKYTYSASSDKVSAYALSGDLYRKYAYKKNENYNTNDSSGKYNSEIQDEEAGSTNTSPSKKKSRKIRYENMITTNSIQQRKQEMNLILHVESYLEFLLLFNSTKAEGLFDGSYDHIIPSTHKHDDEVNDDEYTGNINYENNRTGMSEIFEDGAGGGARKSSVTTILAKMNNGNLSIDSTHTDQLRRSFYDHKTHIKSLSSMTQDELNALDEEKDDVDHFSSIFGSNYQESSKTTSTLSQIRDNKKAQYEADHETQLKALEFKQKHVVSTRKRLMLAMLGAASPELELSETLEVMLSLIKDFFHVDRVGVFVIDKVKNSMTLYMSQFDRMAKLDENKLKALTNENSEDDEDNNVNDTSDSLYVQVPLKGIAGHIAKTGELVILPDCYDHPLFDSSMDEKTGYRTKQMLCVPCFDRPIEGSVVGVLQALNPTGVANTAKAVAEQEAKIQAENRKVLALKIRKGKKSKSRTSSNTESSRGADFIAQREKELAKMKAKKRGSYHATALVLDETDSSSSDSDDSLPASTPAAVVDPVNHDIAKLGGKVNFTKTDEKLSVMIGQLVGTVIGAHKNRASIDLAKGSMSSTPASFIRKPFSLRLHDLVFNIPDEGLSYDMDINDPKQFPAHVTASCCLFDGVNQIGETKTIDVSESKYSSTKGSSAAYNEFVRNQDKSHKGSSTSSKKSALFVKNLPGMVNTYNIEEMIEFPEVWIRNLPLSARLVIQFYGSNGLALGWLSIDVFNHDREIATGRHIVQLWDGACHSPTQLFAWPLRNNENSSRFSDISKGLKMYVQYELKSFDKVVVFAPSTVRRTETEVDDINTLNMPLHEHLEHLTDKQYHRFMVLYAISRGYSSEPLCSLAVSDRKLIWSMRRALVYSTSFLPVFLLSVPWASSECVYEAYQLLAQWRVQKGKWTMGDHHREGYGGINDNNSSHAMNTRTIALTLLYGTSFPDAKIRAFAVIQLLKGLADDELSALLCPLIGSLRYERNVDNALVRYLMRRAVESPKVIGIPFYWHLKSIMDLFEQSPLSSHNPLCTTHFDSLTQLYKRKSGDRVRIALGHAELIHRRIGHIVEDILNHDIEHKEGPTDEHAKNNFGFGNGKGAGTGNKTHSKDHAGARKRALVKLLKQIELPSSFDFPGNSHYRVNELVYDDCQYQKTWPYRSIKLVFRVDEGNETKRKLKKSLNKCALWAKVNVDPSPEKVTLSMLEAFDSLWKTYGLDLHVQTYTVIHQNIKKDSKGLKNEHAIKKSGTAEEAENDKYFNSVLSAVPMHAKSFSELLAIHNKSHDIETVKKSGTFSGMFTSAPTNGLSNAKDWPGLISSGPKEYSTLENREFPDDIMENWFCVQNFESIDTRLKSQEENLRTLNPMHNTVYEKYYSKDKCVRRKSLRGPSSLSTVVDNDTKLFEPNPSSFEWRLKFARSLAGWYVSSYVLHVMNRTADNIMFLPTGEVFNFELTCFNLEERLFKMKNDKKLLVEVPYCPKPTKLTNATDAQNQSRRPKESRNCGYATIESLHEENAVVFATMPRQASETKIDRTMSFRDKNAENMSSVDLKQAKKRANQVTAAVATSHKKSGFNTGSHINRSSLGSGAERTHVPLLPCFTRILGPSNGSVFAYFREYALNAFTVLRSHPEFLLQVLKSSLLSLPAFNCSEQSDANISSIVEAMMCNLMLEMEVDEEAARAKFLSHMQIDMTFYSQTKGKNSYPASKRFEEA